MSHPDGDCEDCGILHMPWSLHEADRLRRQRAELLGEALVIEMWPGASAEPPLAQGDDGQETSEGCPRGRDDMTFQDDPAVSDVLDLLVELHLPAERSVAERVVAAVDRVRDARLTLGPPDAGADE